MFANKHFRILVAFLTLTLCLGLLTVGVRAEEPVQEPAPSQPVSENADQELKINPASSEEEGVVDIESLEAENASQELKPVLPESISDKDVQEKLKEELGEKVKEAEEVTEANPTVAQDIRLPGGALLAEDFDGVTSPALPAGWTTENTNGDHREWVNLATGSSHTSPNAMIILYNSSAAMNDWLFSPGVTLEAGESYTLTFYYRVAGFAENLEVFYGTAANSAGMTTQLVDLPNITSSSYQLSESILTPSSSGTYYLGFHGYSAADQNGLFVDTIALRVSSPNFSNSSKVAPAEVVLGDPITYTIAISNTGDLPATSATMTDVIPANTTYIADSLSCSSGTCIYNSGEDMIEWAGIVAAGASAEVTFAVESDDALPLCGISIANTAIINDPDAPSVVQVSADSDLLFAEPFYSTDFEANDGGFVAQGFDLDTGASAASTWEWGVPNDGPLSANSGVNVWATNLTGNWDDEITDTLTSPTIDLTAYNSGPLLLEYSDWRNHYFDLEWAYVAISTTTTADWVTIWANRTDQTTWTLHQFDISAHVNSGDQLQVRFIWEGNDDNQATDGWFIDDFSVYQGCPSVTLEPETSSAFVCPADPMLSYPLTVANNHDADTIDAMLSGNSWMTSIDPASLAMGAYTTDTVTVSVELPGDALPGYTDTVTVTAMAQTSGLSDIATIQTTAAGLGSGWEDRSTSGHGARYLAVVHDNGYIYQIGGNDAGVFYTGTHRYEIANDTWMTMTEMLTPTALINGAAIDGNIYIPGGQSAAATYDDVVQVYSTTGNSWSTVAPMPVPVRRHEVVALDGLLYVLSGQTTGDTYTNTVQIYDPATDSWSLGAPIPTAVGHASSGVIDGQIYLAGGYDGSLIISTLQIYDPATDSWSMGPAMPTSWVQGADGVVDDRFLIVAGGWSNSFTIASSWVLVYDAAWERWYFLPNTNSLRYGAEGASDGSQFYYVGGVEVVGGSGIFSDRVERLINCGDGVADLEVSKTDEDDPAVTNQVLSYTLEVTNNGYWDASNVMLSDTLPISTTYAGASPACSESGGVVTCALGDLEAFDSISVTVAVNTPSTAGTIVNQASVSADEVDPDLSNNSVSEETTITPLRIELEKTVGLDSGVCADSDTLVLPDGTYDVTYCYNVSNTGLVTLTMHDLSDSELGTIFADWAYTLTPGASYWLTETATLTETTENTAVWTGYDVVSNTASSEASALVDMVLPSIAISKTVGTEAGVCAEDSELLVVAGTEVHYCVEVMNTGAYTLSRHTLADSALGNIFTDLTYDLGPGERVSTVEAGITMSTTITTDTTNIATWTAYDELSNSDVATDTATVTVGSPSIELRKGVGTQPGVCATMDSIYVAPGTDVYYCYRVSNTGDIALDTHSLTDSELGDLLTDVPFVLNPNAAAFIIFSDTISVETVNDATWTASFGDIEATATDSATVLMTEPDALTCNGSTIEFEAGIPSDWMTANVGNVYWSTTDHLDACDNGGNQTNGSGEAACADADQTNGSPNTAPYDSELWTNPFDLDASLVTATLSFEGAYRNVDTGDFFDVDISTDGGATWDNLLSWNENHYDPGEAVSLDLLAYAGESDLIVRYRYYGDGWDWYAQIDQVSLNCVEGMSEIDVSPTELASTQYPDMQADEMLTISNMGDGELMWDITTDVDWASVDMMNGSTAAGGSSDVTVTFDSTDLDPGSYDGILSIASNDSDEPTVDVALMLTVEEEPEAEVETEVEIPAIMLKGGQDLEQTVTISNTGEVDFNWEAYTEDTTTLHSAGACSGTLPVFPGTSLTPDSGMTAAGGSSDVTMNTDSTDVDPGDYTGNLCVTITESGQVIAIPLSMTVTEPTAVEMAELTTQSTSRPGVPLALAVAGMMLVLAGGVVVRRSRRR